MRSARHRRLLDSQFVFDSCRRQQSAAARFHSNRHDRCPRSRFHRPLVHPHRRAAAAAVFVHCQVGPAGQAAQPGRLRQRRPARLAGAAGRLARPGFAAAQANSFEGLPFFIGAVLAALQLGSRRRASICWRCCTCCCGWASSSLTSAAWATLRSAVWGWPSRSTWRSCSRAGVDRYGALCAIYTPHIVICSACYKGVEFIYPLFFGDPDAAGCNQQVAARGCAVARRAVTCDAHARRIT